ncbi:MAG TPA: condensation domain-containing protein, partial [Gemmataceae bacterium]|nr:condensation domain-containing protein [Gemmataceae bacterium]
THLAQGLPDYMVPAAFVILEALPLTPNGKLDRKALPAPEFKPAVLRAPRTPQEVLLCSLFAQTLGVAQVGLDDNFFHLGGDSIVSIQLVSRAREAGLSITPRDVFQYQQVEALAAAARPVETLVKVADPATGALPLTPIMHWLLARGGPSDRFNQSTLLQVPAQLQKEYLAAALQSLLDYHDALRLRLIHGADGTSLHIPEPGGIRAEAVLQQVTIEGLDDAARQACLMRERKAAECRLAPEAGVMLQAVWFEAGRTQPGKLLLVVHHLAVDGVAWRILLPDLAAAWQAIAAGQQPAWPQPSTSFRRWALLLEQEAKAPRRVQELAFWKSSLAAVVPVCEQPLDPQRDTAGTAGRFTLTLPAHLTAPLLTMVPSVFQARINDVLLTGFALAVAQWRQRRGLPVNDAVTINLEGHGREEIFPGVDLSRTVGWFTSLFPVTLDPGQSDDPGRALKTIKEQLRKIPDSGLGYGLLRYSNLQTAAELATLPSPQLGFNYLGRFDAARNKDWGIAAEARGLGGGGNPDLPLAHVIELNACTLDESDGPVLSVQWTWAPALLSEESVRELAQGWFEALKILADCASRPHIGGFTPSDLPLVALTQSEIERLEQKHRGVDDILPLSPLQEGLLFHALYDAQGLDIYTVQLAFTLEGPLEEKRLQTAAQTLLRRHSNLRAGFEHEGLSQPVQVIAREVALPWQLHDFFGSESPTRQERVAQWLAADLTRRFDPARPPLLRFSLLRLTPEEHQLVLTHHHILLDGWSVPLLLQELLTLYAQPDSAAALPRVVPYRDYLAWIAAQDREATKAAWQAELAGLEEATRVAPANTVSLEPEQIALELPPALTQAIAQQARNNGLTLNTLIQGAWGLLLGHLTGRRDVVFGITLAGRPPELPGVQGMVGLLINTLPVRLRWQPADSLLQILTRLQENQSRLIAHQHIGLGEIQRLAGLGELFDTNVVFENYPIDRAALRERVHGLRFTRFSGRDATHFPLCLAAAPGPRLRLRFDYRSNLFKREAAEAMAGRFVRLLEAVVADPHQRISQVDWLAAKERQKILEEWNLTDHPVPATMTLAALFEEQVARSPQATALGLEEQSLSYAELNDAANRLAHVLIARGIGPEDIVALCLPRSFELMVAMLGTLKAGAAYLPLDPDYPPERLAFMLGDARPKMLLTMVGIAARLPADVPKIALDDTATRQTLAQSPQGNPSDRERTRP